MTIQTVVAPAVVPDRPGRWTTFPGGNRSSMKTTRPVTCPGWCDPRECAHSDVDVQHRSAPALLGTADHEFHLALVRADEHAFGRPGDTELLIDVVSTTLRTPTVQIVLRLDEIHEFKAALDLELHRAHFLGAPVPREVAA